LELKEKEESFMEPLKKRMEELILEEKIESLIAIGAATASNCIPCFEHIYEKAITSGVSLAEIKRASDIAEQIKKGAHIALCNTISDLVGDNETSDLPCRQTGNKSCSC
jgi:hypothetical protein